MRVTRSHLAQELTPPAHSTSFLWITKMQLTMTGEYAVRAMIHLASLPEGMTVQISSISAEWDIPETFLRKIVGLLSRAHLIISRRGNGGGIQLAKSPADITLVDVIEAVEGKISLNK